MCGGSEKIDTQAAMLANRLQKRLRHLKKWAQRTKTGAFRLYDRDIPEIPLVLDYYGDAALPQEAALCGALYKRPYEKDDAEEERWLSAMKDSAATALGIEPLRVFLKQRQRQRGAAQYEKMGEARFVKNVNEGGLVFKVNLSDYLDTGLFPDRRLLRSIIRSEAPGKKILNLFSYTGLFSVYAAAGGAKSTDSVDLSNTYLSWARENFLLNGFTAQMFSRHEDFFADGENCLKSDHRLIRADALNFVEKAAGKKLRWDIIVLDPPAFSNSKKMTDSFDLQRDITELLKNCCFLLEPEGKTFLSVNMRRSGITAEYLQTEFSSCAKNVRVTDISGRTVDEDFKGKKTPKSFLICR
jgi:23S rRNA G2069 N7-methylase RlmK/C1962 C5-methylase RlmI